MKKLLLNLYEQAVLHKQQCAVIHGEQRITYAHLWATIEHIAERLRTLGLRPGDGVALLMENSPQYIATYYAIWHAGGYVVALNTALKARELAGLISHCGAQLVLHNGDSKELSKLPKLLAKNIVIQALQSDFKRDFVEQNTAQKTDNNANSLATIIYTSGTTGHPKGVMLSHKNLLSNTESIINYLALTERDKVMCVLPFFYSYGNSVMHTHLAVGATLLLENSFLFPQKILQIMERESVTGFSGVPSTFALLLARTKLENFHFKELRYITQAGGAMAPAKIRALLDRLGSVPFFVMYGQTEASARLTYLEPEMLANKMGSVGRALSGVTLKTVDEHGDEVAIGEQGEVCAKGDNVMLGYLNEPEETAKVVVDGWLKTGDLGYFDRDGYLFLVGRNREMIKSGAHRIAAVEIEEILCECEGVEEVAIVGVADELLGQVLKAFIVLDGSGHFEKRTFLRFCKEHLPQYKIPKSIECVDCLPKTASGKVKKHLLVN